MLFDAKKVLTFDMFIKYLKKKSNPISNEYWKLKSKEENFKEHTFKGNLEYSILRALDVIQSPNFQYWDEVICKQIEYFISNNNNCFPGTIRKFLIDEIISTLTDPSQEVWLEQ
jgi:hypothetical protein